MRPSLAALVLFVVAVVQALPLADIDNRLAGYYGDPLSHASLGGVYCRNVVTGSYHSRRYLAPYGADLAGNYDSPFPFILTCPFAGGSPIAQFHIFVFIQLCLVLFSSFLVGRAAWDKSGWACLYALFIWWSAFSIWRTHQHFTLLSQLWGAQFLLYAAQTVRFDSRRSVWISALLVSLAFAGTFQNISALLVPVVFLFGAQIYGQRAAFRNPHTLRIAAEGTLASTALFLLAWGPMISFVRKIGIPDASESHVLGSLDLLGTVLPLNSNVFSKQVSLPTLPFESYNALDITVVIGLVAALLRPAFWKDRMSVAVFASAVICFILALGPTANFNNQPLFSIPFNEWLFSRLPFSTTRTPARMMTVTTVFFTFLAFRRFAQVEARSMLLSASLFGWIFVTGPVLNDFYFVPSMKYRDILPERGLREFRAIPGNAPVVTIPSAWAQDQAQNFFQLFHGKPITAGYLAYTAYTKETIAKFVSDPFLGKLGCDGTYTEYRPTPEMTDFASLEKTLRERKLELFIVNKFYLSLRPNCASVWLWAGDLVRQPWIEVVDENAQFLLLKTVPAVETGD